MWKYKNKDIRPGKSWRDDNGVLHPSNWNIWSADYKASMGITEIIPDTPPDSRLYNWSMDSDGKITSTAKALDDSDEVPGLKTTLKNKVKKQQKSLLDITDWAIIRKVDKGTDVPSNIQTYRDAIRTKATEMENAIEATSNVEEIATLWVTTDVNSKKSGILYDWPELKD